MKCARTVIQQNVCSKRQKFLGCTDGQNYTDAILKQLAKQNQDAKVTGEQSLTISVCSMNILHDIVCSYSEKLTQTACELMCKDGHKTLQARDYDLLMGPGELQTYSKFKGYKALRCTNTFLDHQCKKSGILTVSTMGDCFQ